MESKTIYDLGLFQARVDFAKMYTHTLPEVIFKEGDLNTATIRLTLLHQGRPIDVSGYKVTYRITTERSNIKEDEVIPYTPDIGVVDIRLASNALFAGSNKMELIVYDGPEVIKRSPTIIYTVVSALVSDGAIAASNEFTSLTKLMKEVREALEAFEVSEASINETKDKVTELATRLEKFMADSESTLDNINYLNKQITDMYAEFEQKVKGFEDEVFANTSEIKVARGKHKSLDLRLEADNAITLGFIDDLRELIDELDVRIGKNIQSRLTYFQTQIDEAKDDKDTLKDRLDKDSDDSLVRDAVLYGMVESVTYEVTVARKYHDSLDERITTELEKISNDIGTDLQDRLAEVVAARGGEVDLNARIVRDINKVLTDAGDITNLKLKEVRDARGTYDTLNERLVADKAELETAISGAMSASGLVKEIEDARDDETTLAGRLDRDKLYVEDIETSLTILEGEVHEAREDSPTLAARLTLDKDEMYYNIIYLYDMINDNTDEIDTINITLTNSRLDYIIPSFEEIEMAKDGADTLYERLLRDNAVWTNMLADIQKEVDSNTVRIDDLEDTVNDVEGLIGVSPTDLANTVSDYTNVLKPKVDNIDREIINSRDNETSLSERLERDLKYGKVITKDYSGTYIVVEDSVRGFASNIILEGNTYQDPSTLDVYSVGLNRGDGLYRIGINVSNKNIISKIFKNKNLTSTGVLEDDISKCSTDMIPVQEGHNYIFSDDEVSHSFDVCFYGYNGLLMSKSNNVYTITIPSKCKYIRISYDIGVDKPQLEHGTIATSYVPYRGYTESVILTFPIDSIGTNKDILYSDLDGAMYASKIIYDIQLGAIGNWINTDSSWASNGNTVAFMCKLDTLNLDPGKNNYPRPNSETVTKGYKYKTVNDAKTTDEECFGLGDDYFYIRILKSKLGGVTTNVAFDNYIKNHIIDVKYIGMLPSIIELPQKDHTDLSFVKGINIVTSTTTLIPPNIKLTSPQSIKASLISADDTLDVIRNRVNNIDKLKVSPGFPLYIYGGIAIPNLVSDAIIDDISIKGETHMNHLKFSPKYFQLTHGTGNDKNKNPDGTDMEVVTSKRIEVSKALLPGTFYTLSFAAPSAHLADDEKKPITVKLMSNMTEIASYVVDTSSEEHSPMVVFEAPSDANNVTDIMLVADPTDTYNRVVYRLLLVEGVFNANNRLMFFEDVNSIGLYSSSIKLWSVSQDGQLYDGGDFVSYTDYTDDVYSSSNTPPIKDNDGKFEIQSESYKETGYGVRFFATKGQSYTFSCNKTSGHSHPLRASVYQKGFISRFNTAMSTTEFKFTFVAPDNGWAYILFTNVLTSGTTTIKPKIWNILLKRTELFDDGVNDFHGQFKEIQYYDESTSSYKYPVVRRLSDSIYDEIKPDANYNYKYYKRIDRTDFNEHTKESDIAVNPAFVDANVIEVRCMIATAVPSSPIMCATMNMKGTVVNRNHAEVSVDGMGNILFYIPKILLAGNETAEGVVQYFTDNPTHILYTKQNISEYICTPLTMMLTKGTGVLACEAGSLIPTVEALGLSDITNMVSNLIHRLTKIESSGLIGGSSTNVNIQSVFRLRSPNGSVFELSVTDDGVLEVTDI